MDLNNYRLLKDFLNENIGQLERSGGSGKQQIYPKFEISAREFLEYAESELKGKTLKNKINCVSNLKRAVDCAFDAFLYVYGLYDIVSDKNLKFEAKLNFLKAIGIISPISFVRLNTIRNKLEHKYKKPEIQELEVYFDLVSAFISILEAKMFNSLDRIEFIFKDNTSLKDYFVIEYFSEGPIIKVSWSLKGEKFKIKVETSNYKEFTYFFRVFFLLFDKYVGYKDDKYILEKINEENILA